MRLARPIWLATTCAAALLALGLAGAPSPGYAQGVPGVDPNKCLAGKMKCVLKQVSGLIKCRERCQKKPERCGAEQAACEAKVRAKFDGGLNAAKGCFAKVEAKADAGKPASVCTVTEDADALETLIEQFVVDAVGTLEGAPPTCGNDMAEALEACDGDDLKTASCTSLGFAGGTLACSAGCSYDAGGCTGTRMVATGQTFCANSGGFLIPCAGTGQDGEIQAGAPMALTDNGNGTVTDINTGLTWEKKSDDGSIHDKDATYEWTASPNIFTDHISTLNTTAFGGHTDWRLPNIRELLSIVHYGNAPAPVASAFDNGCVPGCTVTTCSCTVESGYVSSTSWADSLESMWFVLFQTGNVVTGQKDTSIHVRAVRGGP